MKKYYLFLFIVCFCTISSFSQIIYQHDFGTTAINTHPYTVNPVIYHPNLQNFSWYNNKNAWNSYPGSSGMAIGLSNSSGVPELTLEFQVQTGFQLSIQAFSFWRQRSNTGAQNWSMSINGIDVGNGSIPTVGSNIGLTAVSNVIDNLTGIIKIVLTLSGGTAGTGTFRLDDFTLYGNVSAICTPPSLQASSPDFFNISASQIDLSFLRGNGNNGVIVVVKAGSAVSADPQYGITYTADPDFSGNGSSLGGGKVVYNNSAPGTGQMVNITITGLSPGITYYFHIYEYHTGPCYRFPASVASVTTLNFPQVNAPIAMNRLPNAVDLGATITGGGGAPIIERGTVYKTSPGVSITDNRLAEGGIALSAFTHSRTGLNAETQYFFKGYAINSVGSALTMENNFFTISNPPLEEASDLVVTPVSTSQLDLNWQPAIFPVAGASANGYIILRRKDNQDPDITGIINGAAVPATPAPGTELIATIFSGSITSFFNMGLNSTTQYNYLVIPFTWDGLHPQTCHYYTLNAVAGNGYTLGSGIADHFRSVKDGNWNSAGTWQSSSNNINWIPATSAPTGSAKSIIISNPHKVTLTAPASANALLVESGATLIHRNGFSFNIADDNGVDGSGTDFIVNGIYEIYGEAPTFIANATAEIRNGGLVKVNANVNGKSDDFARYPQVLFKSGSVMQWNTSNPFQTKDVVYFNSASEQDKAIFRVTTTPPGALGSVSPTVFKGKFEVADPYIFTFDGRGSKIFRDGLGGSGTLVHKGGTNASGASGTFIINGKNAVIDGSLILNLQNNSTPDVPEMEIADDSDVTVNGNPVINIGLNGADAGSDLLVNGSIKINAGCRVNLMHGSLIVNGYIDPAGTGNFTAANNSSGITNIIIGGKKGGSAGILSFASGNHFVQNFTMNRTGANARLLMGSDMEANQFVLSNGILATGDHLITWNNSGPVNTGNKNSFIATCTLTDQQDLMGTPLIPSIPFDGKKGFRINKVNNNEDIYFPVGPSLQSYNRMFIRNSGAVHTGMTVTVGVGDVGNTPAPRVNRIWYIKETNPGGAKASMRLYFTKRNWLENPFPTVQEEVENGFNYGDIHLVQKTYEEQFINNSNLATPDVTNFIATPDDTEIFGQYTINVSKDLFGNDNGITGFTRFSVVNAGDFILPLNKVQLQVSREGPNHKIEWLNYAESSLHHYEIESSQEGIYFQSIQMIDAKNNGENCSYSWLHLCTDQGYHYYRIKMVYLNGTVHYSSVASIKNESTSNADWLVYPNPVTGHSVSFRLNGLYPGNYRLNLFNVAGQLLMSQLIELKAWESFKTIYLPSSIVPGVYSFVLSNKRKILKKQMVVK